MTWQSAVERVRSGMRRPGRPRLGNPLPSPPFPTMQGPSWPSAHSTRQSREEGLGHVGVSPQRPEAASLLSQEGAGPGPARMLPAQLPPASLSRLSGRLAGWAGDSWMAGPSALHPCPRRSEKPDHAPAQTGNPTPGPAVGQVWLGGRPPSPHRPRGVCLNSLVFSAALIHQLPLPSPELGIQCPLC